MLTQSLSIRFSLGVLAATAMLAGCSTAPATSEGRVALNDNAQATVAKMEATDPSLRSILDTSVGYVVFPSVGKGAVIVGGGYGHGVVYERGRRVGYADVTQANVGASLGGQSYSQIIVFQDYARFNEFKRGNFTWTANASAVAIKAGAAAGSQFQDGVAIFADADAGLMGDASLGGQRYTYQGD